MRTSARDAIFALLVGFVVEAAAETYEFATRSLLGGPGILVSWVSILTTAVGFVIIWRGQKVWAESHWTHIREAHRFLAIAAALLGAAGLILFLIVFAPFGPSVLPPWVFAVLAILVALGLVSGFLWYTFVGLHLTGPIGKGFLVASAVWAALVSALVAPLVSSLLPTLLLSIRASPFSLAAYSAGWSYPLALYFLSYVLLALAYSEAYLRLRRQRSRAGSKVPREA